MVEVAFQVVAGTSLYNKYFLQLKEKQHFHDLAREFFKKNNLNDHMGYYQEEFLALELSEEQREQYKGQLRKLIDRNNVSYFKKNSPMYKQWIKDVVGNVDWQVFRYNSFWYFGYIERGRYILWDYEGMLYGYLMDYDKDHINLTEEMIQIPLSEYYKAKEDKEANVKV